MGKILPFQPRGDQDRVPGSDERQATGRIWRPVVLPPLDARRVEHRRRMLAFLAISAVRRSAQATQ